MKSRRRNNGFSLIEVLMAVGILAIGMTFIAGIFPAGIYFATIATEQTIAAVAADEAFAKIQLYGGADPAWVSTLSANECVDFNDVAVINQSEFAYPSSQAGVSQKQYYWSALCRKVDANPSRLVQVTVFVCRKIGAGTKYWSPKDPTHVASAVFYPMPVEVSVIKVADANDELQIIDRNIGGDDAAEETFINDGYTIVDDRTGHIYRVVERYSGGPPVNQRIKLDRFWLGGSPALVWVVPPPVNGGRGPCIAVYQKIIRF